MKKILFGAVLLGSLFVSCSKDGDDDLIIDPVSETYINTAAGSTWTYEETDNTDPGSGVSAFTIVSTNKDTTVNGKTYHVYTSSDGGSTYNGKSGNDYAAFESLPSELGGANVDNIYLKSAAAVNSSWVQTYTLNYSGFPLTVNITNTIVGKGLNKTVLGKSYGNVIQVKTDIALSGLAASAVKVVTDIQSFYAPNVGNIETNAKIDYTLTGMPTESSNTTTRLKSATLL